MLPEGVFYTLPKITPCLKAAHNQPKLNVKESVLEESVLEKVPNLKGELACVLFVCLFLTLKHSTENEKSL